MDVVTLEIIEGKLVSTVDEMGVVLARTSMSPIVYEVLDFACGLADPDGQLIAQGNGITLFTGTFSEQLRFVIDKFEGRMRPGDVFATNEAYFGGTHCCDVTIFRPVFVADKLIAFGIATAHWLDIGGPTPGSIPPDATDVYQEGLRLPAIRICVDDIVDEGIADILRANVRYPQLAFGDLNAELAATRIAQRRIVEICERYGSDVLQQSFNHIIDRSTKRSRAVVGQLPDGVYSATDWIDGDGITEERLPIRVDITIAGEAMIFDFTGCVEARRAPINCSRGALLSAVKTVFKALVDPTAPANDGWFAPLSINVPANTVFSAEHPYPTGWYYEGSAQASEVVWKALAPIAEDRFSAGSYMSLCALYIGGADPSNGGEFLHVEPSHGGWGACPDRDGTSGLIALTDGDTYNHSTELLEAKYPFLIRRYALNTEDGSGPGRHRGGFGLIREYEMLGDDAFMFASLGHTETRPWGMAGGGAGTCNYVEVSDQDRTVRLSRTPHHDLRRGARIKIVTGGGGGYGDPKSRPRDAIAADIADGYVSEQLAHAVYGTEPDS